MDDITPKLLNAIKNTYEKEISSNSLIKEITSKIKKGNADYEDMLKYSKELGICLSKAFQKNISDEVLPDSKMYYNIAKSLVEPMCKENYKTIASHCAAVQTSLNQKAGIGIKGIKPTYKEEKTEGIINYISNASKYSEREKSFLQSLSTNAKSIVDDSVKENADFHFKSGLSPKIIRRTSGKTCKWCQNLAGVYDYANVSTTRSDVFRRHANCDCVVVYDPSDGSKKVQDVWSKKWNNQSKFDVVQSKLNDIIKEEKLNSMSKTRRALLEKNVDYNKVDTLKNRLSEEQIIDRLGGGDMTDGSCASLSFAYVGNKYGLDVLDFRGGQSQRIFSMSGNIFEIANFPNVKSVFEEGYNDVKNAVNLLKKMDMNKEFILVTGQHAAIVKHVKEGYLYLELQSNTNNGFKRLDTKALKKRFGCTRSCTISGIKFTQKSCIIDVDSLGKNEEFKKLLGFINTSDNKQMKGVKGYAK